MDAPRRACGVEGRLCTAGPFDKRGAMRHEFPVSPPHLGAGRPLRSGRAQPASSVPLASYVTGGVRRNGELD